MKNKKKLATAAVAITTAAAMLLGGTFAWQSISQTALNEASDVINPGGRLHDDFNGENKDIYVENFADEPIFARIKLQEYMEVVINHGVEGAEVVDTIVGEKRLNGETVTDKPTDNTSGYEYTYVTHYFDQENVTDDYWTWTPGSASSEQVYYMPTFNMNKDSLVADRNGMYVDRIGGISNRGQSQYEDWTVWADGDTKLGTEIYDVDTNTADEVEYDFENLDTYVTAGNIETVEETHVANLVGTTNGLISMSDWLDRLNNGYDTADYWVYDTDGWVYWSSAIPGRNENGTTNTTGLLLDSIELNQVMDDTWYYAINVVAQFVTADDVGKSGGTGFYADDTAPTPEAEALLKAIGVDMSGEIGGGDSTPTIPDNYLELTSSGGSTVKAKTGDVIGLIILNEDGKDVTDTNPDISVNYVGENGYEAEYSADNYTYDSENKTITFHDTAPQTIYIYATDDDDSDVPGLEAWGEIILNDIGAFEVRVSDNSGNSWTTTNGALELSPTTVSSFTLSVANENYSAEDYTWEISENNAVFDSELIDNDDGTFSLHTHFDEHDSSYVVVTVTEKATNATAATIKIILDENNQYTDPTPEPTVETYTVTINPSATTYIAGSTGTINFTATVTDANGNKVAFSADDIEWWVQASNFAFEGSLTENEDGSATLAINGESDNVGIRAAYTAADGSRHEAENITILAESVPTTGWKFLSEDDAEVEQEYAVDLGGTLDLKLVDKDGNELTVTSWSVDGSDSNIDGNGLLTVGESETASALLITATAENGGTYFAYIRVRYPYIPILHIEGGTYASNQAALYLHSSESVILSVSNGYDNSNVTWSIFDETDIQCSNQIKIEELTDGDNNQVKITHLCQNNCTCNVDVTIIVQYDENPNFNGAQGIRFTDNTVPLAEVTMNTNEINVTSENRSQGFNLLGSPYNLSIKVLAASGEYEDYDLSNSSIAAYMTTSSVTRVANGVLYLGEDETTESINLGISFTNGDGESSEVYQNISIRYVTE